MIKNFFSYQMNKLLILVTFLSGLVEFILDKLTLPFKELVKFYFDFRYFQKFHVFLKMS